MTSSILSELPVINVEPLVCRSGETSAVAETIRRACEDVGFFYVVGHGVDEALQARLERLSREFFALPVEAKMRIAMARGGRAWRGYFPVGDELTSGRPDVKEGLYFGAELGPEHPLVKAGTPMHGPNLFPEELPPLRETVLNYMAALTTLGQQIMAGIALSLDLDETYFLDRYTREPLTLFRSFNYPPPVPGPDPGFGVGEHTDYGLLTILKQDDAGGLEVKIGSQWVAAPPIPNSFVCNIGDMLDRMTGGRYLSTPHRVRNASGRDRLSFPFFFDPGFNTIVEPIALSGHVRDNQSERWDQASVHAFQGAYGDYLLGKVGKVFPQLRQW